MERMRRDRNYEELNNLIEGLQKLSVFPSIVWLYAWDVVKDQLDYYHGESGEYYLTNPKFIEKDVWDMFWEDADKNAFTLEYGVEAIHDAIHDWLTDRDILIDAE